jgi:anti-sigma regulatory factor (Ser/Thr protein kinase)
METIKMQELDNNIIENQHYNLQGLIKGDLEKIEKLPRTVRTEDITLSQFAVNAGSVKDLLQISDQIESKLKTYRIPIDKRINFIIALVEAINNAQKHGYQFAQNKVVAINLINIGNDYILVGIESMGEPIPMNKIKNLLNENNPLKIGTRNGRGYILMKNSVDVLYISHYKFYTEVFLGIFKENDYENKRSLQFT